MLLAKCEIEELEDNTQMHGCMTAALSAFLVGDRRILFLVTRRVESTETLWHEDTLGPKLYFFILLLAKKIPNPKPCVRLIKV